jgi:hypothetical protein
VEEKDMAIPRVFVSSTCYDMRYIRENLKFFIKNMGFEPVLSEEGGVYYDPSKHVQDACLAEVPNCQMFVLIIGGRFGSKFKGKAESITNHEYREAAKAKIPVFAMVEQQVNAEYRVYAKNKGNTDVASKIKYPAVDSTKIFDFMEEVESKAINNALVPFSDFNELESYLKQQWAGLMFSFLTTKAENERVTNMLETLTTMSNRIEFLSKQILSSVGKDLEKINALLFENLVQSGVFYILRRFDVKFCPADFIEHKDIEAFISGKRISIKKSRNSVELQAINGPKEANITFIPEAYHKLEEKYVEIRKKMLKILSENGFSAEFFLDSIRKKTVSEGPEEF